MRELKHKNERNKEVLTFGKIKGKYKERECVCQMSK